MNKSIMAIESNKKGLIGELETLAIRMESAGMTLEVTRSWSETVRKAVAHIEAMETRK